MSDKVIQIVKKRVGQQPEFESINHSLENMQKIVGGHIECVRVREDVDMWINEEGLIHNLPVNLVIYKDEDYQFQIVGDVFFASHNAFGETVSLNDEQIAWVVNNLQLIGKTEPNKDEESHFVHALIVG